LERVAPGDPQVEDYPLAFGFKTASTRLGRRAALRRPILQARIFGTPAGDRRGTLPVATFVGPEVSGNA